MSRQRTGVIGRPKSGIRRNRRLSGQVRVVSPTPIGVTGLSEGTGTDLILSFNQPVTLSGIPRIRRDDDALPTAAVVTSATSVTLTYPPSEGEPAGVTIPFEDGAIRNPRGGYVNAGTYPIGFTAAAAGEDGQAAGFVGPGPQTEAA